MQSKQEILKQLYTLVDDKRLIESYKDADIKVLLDFLNEIKMAIFFREITAEINKRMPKLELSNSVTCHKIIFRCGKDFEAWHTQTQEL